MIAIWYGIASAMLIIYAALDGRNFGAGLLQRVVAKSAIERRQVVAAIGPLWTWHEVWLVAFGGTLFAVFPRLLASAFAGYYLALFLIVWCLILRGVSIELCTHLNDRLWEDFWDAIFQVANYLLAILFGAAAGNLVRGVPLDSSGNFSMAFFTDFMPHGEVGLLDWFTVSVAIFATAGFAAHGATYLQLTTQGPVHDRSTICAKVLWPIVALLLVVATVETWLIRPDLFDHAMQNPWCWLGFSLLILSALTLVSGLATHRDWWAFAGSNACLVSLLATGSAAMFPVMLSSTLAPKDSLTAQSVAASPESLHCAAIWWPFGFSLAIAYSLFISRRYVGKKVSLKDDNHDSY
jgi:cytochrome d ubiquinol oxidase subunit II